MYVIGRARGITSEGSGVREGGGWEECSEEDPRDGNNDSKWLMGGVCGAACPGRQNQAISKLGLTLLDLQREIKCICNNQADQYPHTRTHGKMLEHTCAHPTGNVLSFVANVLSSEPGSPLHIAGHSCTQLNVLKCRVVCQCGLVLQFNAKSYGSWS